MNKLRTETGRRFVIIITGVWSYNNLAKGEIGKENIIGGT